jgi:uroporphyrinogen decarboxylase
MDFEKYIGEPDKERVINAMRRQPVDRVPNSEGLIEDKHVEKMLGRNAGNTISVGGDMAKGEADTETMRPMHAGDYIEVCQIIGQDTISVADLWTPFKKMDENGKWVPAFDKSVKNINDFRKLKMPDDSDIKRTLKYVREYKEAVKGTRIGVAFGGGCLCQTLYEFVVGMESFMLACYEDRDFIEEIMEVSTEYWVKFFKTIIDEGIDVFTIGDDIAFKTGLFIPPGLFREIWVPRMARMIAPAKEAGLPVQFHSDGKIDEIIDDLIEMGVDSINPMDPYCIDYRDYKKRYGSRVALSGNIDVEFPLAKGTPEDVEKDVKEHMEVLKPGYGYIAGSSHSIVNYIPYENFVAMINAIHKYGAY